MSLANRRENGRSLAPCAITSLFSFPFCSTRVCPLRVRLRERTVAMHVPISTKKIRPHGQSTTTINQFEMKDKGTNELKTIEETKAPGTLFAAAPATTANEAFRRVNEDPLLRMRWVLVFRFGQASIQHFLVRGFP